MFTTTRRVTLRDADAAGVLFFARYLTLAHDAYEEFMISRGISFRAQLTEGTFILPVVHAECDYRLPLWVGDVARIEVNVAEVRSRTYTISYVLYTPDGHKAATCKTVHAVVDKETRKAVPLPKSVLDALGVAEPQS